MYAELWYTIRVGLRKLTIN